MHCHFSLITASVFSSSAKPTVLKSADAPQNTEKDQSEALVSSSSERSQKMFPLNANAFHFLMGIDFSTFFFYTDMRESLEMNLI